MSVKLSDLTRVKVIGEGAYGKVYKTICQHTGKHFALKKYITQGTGAPADMVRETATLRALKDCPNIVHLVGAYLENNVYHVVMEFCDGGTLGDVIRRQARRKTLLAPDTVRSYMQQLVQGIHACHTRGIIHRDIKPQNILLTGNRTQLKLADFGCSRNLHIPQTMSAVVCTLWYRPPEVLLSHGQYTHAVDIWSLGCVLGELISTKAIMQGGSAIDQLYLCFRLAGTPTEATWPGVSAYLYYNAAFPVFERDLGNHVSPSDEAYAVFDLIMQCNPAARPTTAVLLNHPYFHPPVLSSESC
jgi:serine/threonine protein kinase